MEQLVTTNTTDSSNKGLRWFLGLTIIVAMSVGVYATYQYVRINQINSTVTTPTDAIAIINQKLAQS